MLSVASFVFAVGVLFFLYKVSIIRSRPKSPLDELPIYGLQPGIFGYFKSRWNILTNLEEIAEQGYQECNAKSQPFRVPWPGRKQIVFLPSGLIDEIKNMKEAELSKLGSVNELLDIIKYTQVPHLSTHIYHADAIRATMNNNAPEMLAALEEELILAFEDEITELEKTADTDGWFRLPADATLRIVSRAATRAMNGLALCRNEEYHKLMIEFSLGFAKAGFAGMLLPDSIRNIIRPILSRRTTHLIMQITEVIRPEAEKRMKQLEVNIKAKEEGRQNEVIPLPADTLSCMIEEAYKHGPGHFNVESIAGRCRINSFTAIHSTNLCIFHSLLNLASLTYRNADGKRYAYTPELQLELIETYNSKVIPETTSEARRIDHPNAFRLHPSSKGWSIAALDKLQGLDSFIRETLRMRMQGPTSLQRTVALEEGITLKNGLHLPKGTFIAVPARSIQIHQSSDEDAAEFNGWRTGKPGGLERGDAATTTSKTYFPFGTGKHACPGRFFAVKEIKLALKHILLNYEIKEIEPRAKDPNLFVYQIPPTRDESLIQLRRRKLE